MKWEEMRKLEKRENWRKKIEGRMKEIRMKKKGVCKREENEKEKEVGLRNSKVNWKGIMKKGEW